MKYFQFSIYFIFYISFIGSAAADAAYFIALAAAWAAIFSKIHTIAIPSVCICVCVCVCYAANSSAAADAAAAGDRDASLW